MNAPKMLDEICKFLEKNNMENVAETLKNERGNFLYNSYKIERVKTKENSNTTAATQIIDILTKATNSSPEAIPLKANNIEENIPRISIVFFFAKNIVKRD